ncbi:type VI secretion system-associated FHA domain protein TagH [uncultured Comamonas sp.]|uniref:type VI secretion system-associated FHA domain protein TagH n=1 Tax=uncultured Comamonas sp. TaxID=114710 RepID=UPI0037494C89
MFLQLSARLAYANGETHVVQHVFDRQGGTLGRDPNCQMVLLDPFRRISRIQAQVYVEDERFILLNASTSNAIYVDDRELRPGEICPVEKGATWVTGNYTILVEDLAYEAQAVVAGAQPVVALPSSPEVQDAEQLQAEVRMVPSHPTLPTAPPPTEQGDTALDQATAAGPFGDLLSTPLPASAYQAAAGAHSGAVHDAPQALSASLPVSPPLPSSPPASPTPAVAAVGFIAADPFADLLATPVSEPDALAAQGMAFKSATLIPEDFNVLAPNGAPERNSDDPLAQIESAQDLPQMFPGQSLDAIYQPAEAEISVMVQDPLASKQHQRLIDATIPVDPMQMFVDAPQSDILEVGVLKPGQVLAADQALSDHRVEVGSYFRAPRAIVEDPALGRPDTPSASSAATIPEAVLAPLELSSATETDIGQQQVMEVGTSVGATEGGATTAINAQADSGDDPDCDITAPHVQVVVTPPSVDIPPQAEQQAIPKSDETHMQALLDSFKQGAGLTDCRYPEQLTPELMFMLGKMLAESVQGCMDLLSARAAAKQEVRVSVTLINAEANNPLKFLPTGSSVLAQIFGPRMAGFQDGPTAIADAFQDLRSHEVAMMAGTQAAVRGLFDRFDPHYLEEQLQSQGRAKPLFSSQRDARLWDLYRSRYEWLKDEIKNQSPTSWGAEFLSAYQAEVAHNSDSKSK